MSPIPGCITEAEKEECCFIGICLDCWVAFDQSDDDLVDSVGMGSWLGFILLMSVSLFNLYWYFEERRLYYRIKGQNYMPMFKLEKTVDFFGGSAAAAYWGEMLEKQRLTTEMATLGNDTNHNTSRHRKRSIIKNNNNNNNKLTTKQAGIPIDGINRPLTSADMTSDAATNALKAARDDKNIESDDEEDHKVMVMGGKEVDIYDVDSINEEIDGIKHSDNDNDASNMENHFDVCYPWFRLIHVGYPGITAFFAIFRYEWMLGKPLLVGAAIHNLFEWAMVSYAYNPTPAGRYKFFLVASGWIWFVICCVVMIPTFPQFALVEQASGILLDFLLPYTWWHLAQQNWDKKDIRNMFLVAWFAHFVHLYGTILPLVIENYNVSQSYHLSAIMEFLIFMTAMMTFVLYTAFTSIYQTKVLSLGYLPKNLVAHKLWKYCIIAFLLGLITTTISPALIGECEHHEHDDYNDYTSETYNTTASYA